MSLPSPSDTSHSQPRLQKWWHFFDSWKVGIIPLPIFALAGVLIVVDAVEGSFPSNIVVMTAVLAFCGFACGEIGHRLPLLGKMGAAAICATFIPSALVYYGLLPDPMVKSVTQFFKSSNILYLYICCIIVGSIMSMNRKVLIQGFIRIFIPMACGEVVGMLLGTGLGMALGLDAFHTFFFIVLPIMAGGVGEGAIPLSIGYASILHMQQGVAFGQILPMVMLGSLIAIITAGVLNLLGKRYPHLTGEGRLLPDDSKDGSTNLNEAPPSQFDVSTVASGALLAILLYMIGMLAQQFTGLPAPVAMLFVAVLLKLSQVLSPKMLEGSGMVYHFFRSAVTYPVLFAVGVAITPWQSLMSAFTVVNLLVIMATVLSLIGTGFIVGRKMGMYPIDVAIVSCCQSGQGGTGDVAILTSGNRMVLMPFAQIATRIGGAINVSVALLLLNHFMG
ncbi:2-hydroxycarboxylate transporter family protein [Gallaecimonas mangrovi]|uniref:2-hydroxycarboxylate transporter family protein n=1 Tax=Gallaecimonas mangrovi TaxID=2291597 RepID=UPI000E20B5E3|nr:2-hydroxycarboxylate transporter family protein [Gallaecimonas mangrovi]